MTSPTTRVDQQLAQAFARVQPPGLVVAYLFGSHADDRAHRESDVDVAVLLDRSAFPSARERFDERVRLTSWIVGVLHVNAVDIVVLNDVAPQFGRHIITQGHEVYCADRATAHAFVRDVQLRAVDIEPFLRRTRQIKATALARR